MADNGFDGLELDWQYPDSTTDDFQNYQTLSAVLREEVDTRGDFLLTASVGVQFDKLYTDSPAYNVTHLSDQMDMINLKTYGLHGDWEDRTGHHALAHEKLIDDRLE